MFEMNDSPGIIMKMLWKALQRWFSSRHDDWRSSLHVNLRVDISGVKLQMSYSRYKRHKTTKPRGKNREKKKGKS